MDPGHEAPRSDGRAGGGTVQTCRVGPPEAPSASQSDETQMNGAATSTMLVCATASARVPQPEVRGPLGDPARHCKTAKRERRATKKCGNRGLNK